MIYADYAYYIGDYMGNLVEESEFLRLASRASAYLDYYTQGRAVFHGDMPQVKNACCALAEKYQIIERIQRSQSLSLAAAMENPGKELQSETVGPLTKTYKSSGESAAFMADFLNLTEQQLAAVVRQYLSGTGLLYRGKGGCGCSRIP